MFSLNQGGLFGYLFLGDNPVFKCSSSVQFYLFNIAFVLVTVIVAYLLGSLNSAIIVSKILYKDDIRRHGSGNAGLTNTLRTYGKNAALLTLFGDILKTVLAVFFGGVMFGFGYFRGVSTSDMCYVAGLFAVLGHIFPIYYKFKGGKGVLASATMALMLSPIPLLILFAVFAAIVAMSKYVSLGSVCGGVLYPVILHSYFALALNAKPYGLVTLSAILLALLIVWCHRENLKRIGERTERKLSFKKKPEVDVKSLGSDSAVSAPEAQDADNTDTADR